LKTSVEKFGLADKPIINTDGTIIGGHQRLKILKELGHKEIEVLVPNRELTPEEVDEMNIRLNKNTGEWCWETLANEWNVNDLIDWGFNEHDLHLMLDDDDKPPSEEKEEGCKCPTCGKKMKRSD
jgi:ParB-like chromosome segregation protein Spo0J